VVTTQLILAIIAIVAARVGWLYLAPFGPCPRCHGSGHVPHGRRGVKACPPCEGRRRVQRHGSRTVHRLARRVRDGRKAAARYKEDTHGDT
jgi:DnaJ-class molecular chaperone